jgi:hypothetical protein
MKKGTHQKINGAINKYESIIAEQDISTEEDAVKIEMSDEFVRELKSIRESFLKNE